MLIQNLTRRGLLSPPKWLPDNTIYLTSVGSQSYGVASDTFDWDIIGVCIPRKDVVFPHTAGHLYGFGEPSEKFEQFQTKVFDPDAAGGKGREYDITIYNIVRYFWLCFDSNPNMIDSLFTHYSCVLHSTPIGELIRENRKMFLSKRALLKFKSYAYSQLHKINSKKAEGKRVELIEKYSFDVKFAYNLVRLLDECDQILTTGDIDLMRNREQLKAIRRGEWTIEQINEYFNVKSPYLEQVCQESDLPTIPDKAKVQNLLLECINMHYKITDNEITKPNDAAIKLQKVKDILWS